MMIMSCPICVKREVREVENILRGVRTSREVEEHLERWRNI